jgi:8-amino-7-oxononanoate synthase
MDIFDKCNKFTQAREAIRAGYYPYFKPIQTAQAPEVRINGERKIVCCSNNYLGLTVDPRVKRACIDAIRKYGTSCTGSRFLSGSLELHERVEQKFAKFIGKESAILFTTGHHSNLGTISALTTKGEVIITDKLDHASIIDGCRLSYAEMVRFKHNDMNDLERVLIRYKDVNKLIVVDGVFSMEGDIINLPEVIRLAKKYNARVMVDDAHSLGVLGKNGKGTAEHFGIDPNDVDIIMVTASKSLASIGGLIAADEKVIHYIKHFARSMIYTASLPPAQVAAIDMSLNIIISEPERRERLWRNVKKMADGFRALGYNIRNSQSAIIPIIIGDETKVLIMWRALYDEGVFCSPVVSPAVPEGESLIRTSYMAIHTDEQLDYVLNAFEKVGKKLGVIPGTYRPKPVKPRMRRFISRMRIGAYKMKMFSKRIAKRYLWFGER